MAYNDPTVSLTRHCHSTGEPIVSPAINRDTGNMTGAMSSASERKIGRSLGCRRIETFGSR